MEATVVSVGKAVLDGALGYARSKAADELALQLGMESDVAFIADELQMMQSFLATADEEDQPPPQQRVVATWVTQVRDLAYDVEDSLMDCALHSEKTKRNPAPCSPWRWGQGDRRHHISQEVKTLRAKVEDVSNRNLRYQLVKPQLQLPPAAAADQQLPSAMFGINEANLATGAELELGGELAEDGDRLRRLLSSDEAELRVVAMWGTAGDPGKASAIKEAYDSSMAAAKFGLRAWVGLARPFDPTEFLRGLVRQFFFSHDNHESSSPGSTTAGWADALMKMDMLDGGALARMFDTQVGGNSYLVVIDGLSTMVEWQCIKMYFPDKKNGSRIVVSTQHVEIASLCTEKPYQVSKLKRLSYHQTLYLFHSKIIPGSGAAAAEPIVDSTRVTIAGNDPAMPAGEIQEEDQQSKDAEGDKVSNSSAVSKVDRSRTMAQVEDMLTGREMEKSKVIQLIGQPKESHSCKVISVWGMGGLGKTTLVRSVYRSQQLGGWKRAWATALRPFNLEALLRNLAMQLQKGFHEDPMGASATRTHKTNIASMKLHELEGELIRLLNTQKCLIVLDDISSAVEWELVKKCLESATRVIVTTREKIVAQQCSTEYSNIYSLRGLKDDAALDLFKRKVLKNNTGNNSLVVDMMEQARLILKKCDGLPLAISAIAGYLATKPKTAIEWAKMNGRISAELEISPELRIIKTVLMRSYDGLPYHLKSCFLYMSLFPEDHIIKQNRLVRRWIAEGYLRDMRGMTAEELGDKYLDELFSRSMILRVEWVNNYSAKLDACQLHDMIREICILKAREENLVFTLEEGCCLSGIQGALRHLVISSNWKRDKDVLESMLDLSHVRSMTVFGEWRSFFISSKMRFLRVLDLEGTLGLQDHHLDQIGQLLHLKFFSLRGCRSIFFLPNSIGNLRHLETLDIRGTCISQLPATVTKLQKLQYLRAHLGLNENDRLKAIYGKRSFSPRCCALSFMCAERLFPRRNREAYEDHESTSTATRKICCCSSLLFHSRMRLSDGLLFAVDGTSFLETTTSRGWFEQA